MSNMRRRKEEDMPKGKSVARRVAFWFSAVSVVALVFGLFSAATRAGYVFASESESLMIRTIDVVGSGDVVRQEIEKRLEKTLGQNILAFDIKKLGEEISSHTWVKRVSIRRDFPSRLTVEVIERIPVARVETGSKSFLMDVDGFLMTEAPEKLETNVPLITGTGRKSSGLKPGAKIDTKLIEPALYAVKMLSGYSLLGAGEVLSVDLSFSDRVVVSFSGIGATVTVPKGDWIDEVARLYTVDYLLRQKEAKVANINLLFDGKAVVTFSYSASKAKGA